MKISRNLLTSSQILLKGFSSTCSSVYSLFSHHMYQKLLILGKWLTSERNRQTEKQMHHGKGSLLPTIALGHLGATKMDAFEFWTWNSDWDLLQLRLAMLDKTKNGCFWVLNMTFCLRLVQLLGCHSYCFSGYIRHCDMFRLRFTFPRCHWHFQKICLNIKFPENLQHTFCVSSWFNYFMT